MTLARVMIRNNLFAGVGMTPGTGRAFQLLGGPPDVTIEDNTVVHGAWPNTFLMFDQQPPARGLVIRNNILSYGLYGMYGSGVVRHRRCSRRTHPVRSSTATWCTGSTRHPWLDRVALSGRERLFPDASTVVFGEGMGYQPGINSP